VKRILLFVLVVAAVSLGYYLLKPGPEIKNVHPAGEHIICFGDSLTYGTGADPGMDYPSQLSRMIGRSVINAGVPGDTTDIALQRLERDVLSRSPRIVIITLGGNDLKNRLSKEEAFQNLKRIIEAIQAKDALVIVGGIDLPLWGSAFAVSYQEVCSQTGAILVPNVYKGIWGHHDLMSDPIHPNSQGYTIMAQRFYDALKPYL
jgi:acyl-CoA thioesterase-1